VQKAVLAIDDTLRSGKGVLVHCFAGVSRSASVVAAFLMAREGLTAAQAMARIRTTKPETFTGPEGPQGDMSMQPNFLEGLLLWQDYLGQLAAKKL
jgi:protein-tyrosine phosphatase